jgi:hypothetical protein
MECAGVPLLEFPSRSKSARSEPESTKGMNQIEQDLATVAHRRERSRGCGVIELFQGFEGAR